MPLPPSQIYLGYLLTNQPRRDGTSSWRWCKVASAEIRTRVLAITMSGTLPHRPYSHVGSICFLLAGAWKVLLQLLLSRNRRLSPCAQDLSKDCRWISTKFYLSIADTGLGRRCKCWAPPPTGDRDCGSKSCAPYVYM